MALDNEQNDKDHLLSFTHRGKKRSADLLGTSNKGHLGNIVVADVNGDLLSSGLGVSHANLDACLHIVVRDLNAGGQDIPVPVVLDGSGGHSGLST